MAEKNTNIRLVLDNLLQHPMLDGLTLERAVNYAANFINIVGVPRIFEEKQKQLLQKNIRDYFLVTLVILFK